MANFELNKGRYAAPHNSRYAAYIKNRTTDGKDTNAVDVHAKSTPLAHGSYGALILHPNWKARRKEILTRDQHRCRICNSIKELQVHHRQYLFVKATQRFKSPWDYPDHLMITLCSNCHSRGHAMYKVPSIII